MFERSVYTFHSNFSLFYHRNDFPFFAQVELLFSSLKPRSTSIYELSQSPMVRMQTTIGENMIR